MKENVPITDPVWMVDPNWMQKTGGYAKDMTMRDHIAIEAMKAMLGPFLLKELDEVDPNGWMSGVSMDAFSMADAMLRERDEK